MRFNLRWHSPFWHSAFGILPIVLTIVLLLAPLSMITWRSFVEPNPPAQFLRIDFKDPTALRGKLLAQSDPLSTFLLANFTARSKQELAARHADTQGTVDVLLFELGNIVTTFTNSIYDPQRFNKLPLSQATINLLSQKPLRDPARLNRLLLEDAYPAEISRSARATRGFQVAFQPHRRSTYASIFKRALVVATVDTLLAVPFAFLLCAYTRPSTAKQVLLILTLPFLVNESIRAYCWRSLFQAVGISLQGGAALTFVQIITTMPFCLFPAYFVATQTLRTSWVVCDDLDISMVRRFFLVFLPLTARGACMGWVACFSLAISATAEPAILMWRHQQSFGNEVSALWSASEHSAAAALALSVCLFVGLAVFTFYLLAQIPIWGAVFRMLDATGHRLSLVVAPRFAPIHETALWGKAGHTFRVGLIALLVGLGMAPIVVTLYKSFSNFAAGQFDLFHWYKALAQSSELLEGLRNSLLVAIPVGLATVITAYLLGYTVWRSRAFLLTAFCLCFLVFVPANAYALGMAELEKLAGATHAHLSVLGLCQLGSFLPFCFVVVVISQLVLEPALMGACMELGATRLRLVVTVVPRMVWPIITSAMLVGVLLSLNDYIRPTFLASISTVLESANTSDVSGARFRRIG